MREIIDQLIEERAPWLRRGGSGWPWPGRLLHRVLHYERTIKIGEALEPMPGAATCMQSLADMIALHVEVTGLENLPRQGPAMVVCNHPTGIADGIVLYGALAQLRPDLFIFANADAIRVMPQLDEPDRAGGMASGEAHPQAEPRDPRLRPRAPSRPGAAGGALPLRAAGQAPLAGRCTSGRGWPRGR